MAKVDDIRMPKDRKAAFEMLWRNRLLGDYGTIPEKSSTLPLSHNIRKALQHLIDSQAVRSILDVGCGDWNWMQTVNLNGACYTGIDIVQDCIDHNIKKHLQPNVNFKQMDIVLEAPAQKYDLILARDVLTHMTRKEVIAAINNIKRSGGTYFAATSYYAGLANPADHESRNDSLNADISTGYWRPMNLRQAPYYFPAPIISVVEKKGSGVLDIWKLNDILELNEASRDLAASHGAYTADDIKQLAFIKKLSALTFVKRIGLYGSRMLGTYKPDSDIDLMLYCDSTPNTDQWVQICDILDHADTPLEIDCKLFCPEVRSILDKPDVYQYHMDHMITLYERGLHAP